MGYHWNIMWLDTFALLPLVILGTVDLLRDEKYILYTISLCFSIICNYVCGLFTCIFVFLFFFAYQVCRWNGNRRFVQDLWRIAVFSLLAIGLTAFIEIPAVMALQTAGADSFPTDIILNFTDEDTVLGVLGAFLKVMSNMGGAIPPTVMDGLPNIYCGVFSVFFFFLYLMSKEIPVKEKLCTTAILLFVDFSFIIGQLDYIWHGFHFTKLIPFRFSYLHSFVILMASYRIWLKRSSLRAWMVITAGILSVAVLASSECMALRTPVEIGSLYFFIPPYMMFNAAFLGVYGLVLLISSQRICMQQWRKKFERYTGPALLLIMCMELVASLWCFRMNFSGADISDYPMKEHDTNQVIEKMKDLEEATPFFRAEMTHGQTQNDGALNNYSGTSAFVSTSNISLIEFMRSLGFSAMDYWNRYLYEEASPVSDLFLGIKYRIAREESDRSSRFYQEVYRSGDVALLENQRYLPLGFLAEKELAGFPFSMEQAGGPFQFQNQLFTAATGAKGQLWSWIAPENLTVTGHELAITDSNGLGYTAFLGETKDAKLTYSYLVDQEGFLCLYLTFPTFNRLNVIQNGELLYHEEMGPPQMFAVGDVKPGDVVEVEVLSYSGEEGSVTIEAAVMDCQLFDKGYERLCAATLELQQFESTYVEGTIDCDRDGLLYTSIPQNGNWRVKVDGKEAEITLVGDCMVAVELTEGKHTVAFSYENKAFNIGWKVSLVCAGVFAGLYLLKRKRQK